MKELIVPIDLSRLASRQLYADADHRPVGDANSLELYTLVTSIRTDCRYREATSSIFRKKA